MNSLYVCSIIFFCIAYLIITDQSVAKGIYLLTELVKVQYEKTKWRIIHDPANPIVKYFISRRSYKLAEELRKELESKNK